LAWLGLGCWLGDVVVVVVVVVVWMWLWCSSGGDSCDGVEVVVV